MTKMTVSEIIAQLSPQAREVLEQSSDRIGTTVVSSYAVQPELNELGIVGVRGGLTIKGSAVVCRVKPELPF